MPITFVGEVTDTGIICFEDGSDTPPVSLPLRPLFEELPRKIYTLNITENYVMMHSRVVNYI